MEKLTFKRQIILGLIFILVGNILAFASRQGIFSNFAWVIYGLLFVVHPVFPEQYRYNENKVRLGARIAGIVCIIIGVMTRFVP